MENPKARGDGWRVQDPCLGLETLCRPLIPTASVGVHSQAVDFSWLTKADSSFGVWALCSFSAIFHTLRLTYCLLPPISNNVGAESVPAVASLYGHLSEWDQVDSGKTISFHVVCSSQDYHPNVSIRLSQLPETDTDTQSCLSGGCCLSEPKFPPPLLLLCRPVNSSLPTERFILARFQKERTCVS